MLTRLKILIRLVQVLRWKPPDDIWVRFIILADLRMRVVVHRGPSHAVLEFGADYPVWHVRAYLNAAAELLIARTAEQDADEGPIAKELAEAEAVFERGMSQVLPETRQ